MALTKITTNGLADNSVTDAKVADAITVTGAQTGITQVGTITAGTWQGTKVASAYLDDDTAHLSGSAFTGTISSSTSSTTDSALTLTDAGVADYKFTFPDTSTIRLSTSTSSTKVFDLSNAGSGKMKLSVDGGLRPITGSDYSLVLESTNELNFYNADGYADSNRATLHINYSGTGSTVDLSNSELVVVKGTGSTFAGNIVMSEDKRISIGTWDNSGFTGSNAYGLSIDSELPIVHMSDTDTNKKAFFGLSGDNMYIGGNPVDDMIFQTGSGVERLRIRSSSTNWCLDVTSPSPYGMQITTTASNSSSHDMFKIKRGDGTACFEVYGDGNVYGTNEFISDYGFRSKGTAGAAPTGDDHHNVPIKMVAYRKTVSSTDVSNGYIDFDTDIYRDNIISGITNHFGAAATNVNNIGYNPGYGHSLHFYAGGGCRLYFGGSVVQNDKMGIVLFFYGSTG